jgi:hypothetical protein
VLECNGDRRGRILRQSRGRGRHGRRAGGSDSWVRTSAEHPAGGVAVLQRRGAGGADEVVDDVRGSRFDYYENQLLSSRA